MEQLALATGTIVAGVFACVAWFWGSNLVLDLVWPPRGPQAGRNITRANLVRPWLFIGPAVACLGLYLFYPVLNSAARSLMDAGSRDWVGFDNYRWLIADAKFRESMANNLLWLLIVPAASTFLGLVAAQVTDRIRWGNLAKSLIFMPMAISFVGAGVIWKFI